ncbi:unnamed protein product [Triticum turgidum subsp. durum]|uniref:Uncharacterized protein n=1 Tax=Triticum turgidum subsp. durum TaxID=4567 RepID=A0A9R1NWD4_TRITD|nr:unnamed protein product [Triticum turgidum subsp. durum]
MQHAPKFRPALPFVQIHASRSAPLPAARDSGAPLFLPPSARVGPLANEQHPAPARAQADEQYGDWPRMETSAGAAAGEAVAAADLVTAGSARRSWPAGVALGAVGSGPSTTRDWEGRIMSLIVQHYKQQPLSHESLSRWYSIYILLQETTNKLCIQNDFTNM